MVCELVCVASCQGFQALKCIQVDLSVGSLKKVIEGWKEGVEVIERDEYGWDIAS
jgi:hypothetical protein